MIINRFYAEFSHYTQTAFSKNDFIKLLNSVINIKYITENYENSPERGEMDSELKIFFSF